VFDLDLPEIADSIWYVFGDLVPEEQKLEKADALIDLIINDCNDKDSYLDMMGYCENHWLRVAAENNVRRIEGEGNVDSNTEGEIDGGSQGEATGADESSPGNSG